MNTTRMHLLMCFGTGCVSSGAEKVRDALVKELVARGLSDAVAIEDMERAATPANIRGAHGLQRLLRVRSHHGRVPGRFLLSKAYP